MYTTGKGDRKNLRPPLTSFPTRLRTIRSACVVHSNKCVRASVKNCVSVQKVCNKSYARLWLLVRQVCFIYVAVLLAFSFGAHVHAWVYLDSAFYFACCRNASLSNALPHAAKPSGLAAPAGCRHASMSIVIVNCTWHASASRSVATWLLGDHCARLHLATRAPTQYYTARHAHWKGSAASS